MAAPPRALRPRPRVLAAIPAIAFAIFIVVQGELFLVGGLILLSVIALSELYTLMRRVRPIDIAGFLAVIGLILAAHYGEPSHVVIVLVCAFPVTFFFSLPARRGWRTWPGRWRPRCSASSGSACRWPTRSSCATCPHGDGLLIDVLVGTFIGDTAAYFGGPPLRPHPAGARHLPEQDRRGAGGRLPGRRRWRSGAPGSTRTGCRGPTPSLIGALVALVAPSATCSSR